MSIQCLLCAEETQFIGIGQCNHEPFCYRCIYKMRVISKNNTCPICKIQCKQIIIAAQYKMFSSFVENILGDQHYSDIFYASKEAKIAFEKLVEYKCFLKINGNSCKTANKFPSLAFLKKHLKQEHKRLLCDICVEHKTSVLQQQKLYTTRQLKKHEQRGDIDEFGNVIFLHPYCIFCNGYYFDEEHFSKHLHITHLNCQICSTEYKYYYYKNENSLQIHYKLSHYTCNQEDCVGKQFIAFRSVEDLKLHKLQVHDHSGMKKIDISNLCGFQYEHHKSQSMKLKDQEGIDMQNQFLSLKKNKNRALGEADQQNDLILDPRCFYRNQMDEDEHFQMAFTPPEGKKITNKKTVYISKTEAQKQQKMGKRKQDKKNRKYQEKQQQNLLFIDELYLIKTIHYQSISYEEFQSNLKNVIRSKIVQQIINYKFQLLRNKITAKQFIEYFFQCMQNQHCIKQAYHIFPHFIRTILKQDIKLDLDYQYVKKLKSLSFKFDNLIKKSYNYSDFFDLFFKQIENNIQKRIIQGILSIKKPIHRCKQRLFQLMSVVRHLKIQQMIKLKFATNFGLQNDTLNYLNKIFKREYESIAYRLDKIPNEQILDLYVFVKYSLYAIKHVHTIQSKKNQIHDLILEDFLYDRPELQKKYGIKKEDLKTLQEKVQYEKHQEQKQYKKQLKQIQRKNEQRGYHNEVKFDSHDFPELIENTRVVTEQNQNKKFKEVVDSVNQKPATYEKKINQMFPTLGQNNNSDHKNKNSSEIKKNKNQSPSWWQKINQKQPQILEEQEQKPRKKGKNKKSKWVSVKGLFN